TGRRTAATWSTGPMGPNGRSSPSTMSTINAMWMCKAAGWEGRPTMLSAMWPSALPKQPGNGDRFSGFRTRGIVCRVPRRNIRLLAQCFQPLANLGLIAAVDRLVIAAGLRQVSLRDPATVEIVAVLISFPASQLLGAGIMIVAQVIRHHQGSARPHILASLPDGHGRRVRLGRRRNVCDRLGQRELTLRKADKL